MNLKKIQAIIRASKFEDVRKKLHSIGVEYFIFYEAKGVSFQNEQKGSYRGVSVGDSAAMTPKRIIEVVVPEIDADDVVNAIKTSASTGEAGDGKIYVSDIETGIRI